jgi:hypothetical protein
MSSTPTDKGNAEVGSKRPDLPLELKKLSSTAALEWLESKSASSDPATSEQVEELEKFVRALISEETAGKYPPRSQLSLKVASL